MNVLTEFIIESVTIPAVSVLGFLGNLCAIVVLLRPEMKTTFHQILVTLAVIENLFLLTILTDHAVEPDNQFYIIMLPYFWNPLKNILLCWETFLIMSISTERYLAVRNPLAYRMQKMKYSSATHLAVYIFPSGLAALLINIPKFFETELRRKEISGHGNSTRYVYDYNITSLRLNPDYIFYYIHCTRLAFTGVLPFVFLTCMNFFIYRKMNETRLYKGDKRKLAMHAVRLSSLNMTEEARKRSIVSYEVRIDTIKTLEDSYNYSKDGIILDPNNFHSKKIGNSAATLITIVLVYVILNMPRLLLNVMEYFLFSVIHNTSCPCDQTPVWVSILARVSHLFLAINSSINFLIYYSIGRKFKSTLNRYRSKKQKSNADFSLNFSTEHRELIPLQFLTNRIFKKQRSASLPSLDLSGVGQKVHRFRRQRSTSITMA